MDRHTYQDARRQEIKMPVMTITLPEQLNIADWLLDARVREGRGDRPALLTDQGTFTYREVQTLANRFGHLLKSAGVEQSEEHTSELQSQSNLVCRLLLETKQQYRI